MRKTSVWNKSLMWVVAGGLVTTGTAWAKTLEEVEKDLIAATEKKTSYTAKMETIADMKMGEGMSSKSETKGTIEAMHKDGKYLMRSESKTQMVMKMGDTENKMDSSSLSVMDGEYMYTLSENMGMKNAMKMKVKPEMTGQVKQMFETWKKDYDLKVLDDAKVDGADCYVIEATAKKKDENSPVSKMIYHFRKADAIMAKMEGFGKDPKPSMVTTLKDIKTGVELSADRFVFKAPEGVQIMDMDAMQQAAQNQAGSDASASEEPAATAEEPKAEEPKAEAKEEKKEEKKEGLGGLGGLLKKKK